MFLLDTYIGGLTGPNSTFEPLRTIQDVWDWIMSQKIGDFFWIFILFNLIPICIWIYFKIKKHKAIYQTLNNTEKIIQSLSKKNISTDQKDIFEPTEKEITLLQAYKTQKEMQDVVDRILKIKK